MARERSERDERSCRLVPGSLVLSCRLLLLRATAVLYGLFTLAAVDATHDGVCQRPDLSARARTQRTGTTSRRSTESHSQDTYDQETRP